MNAYDIICLAVNDFPFERIKSWGSFSTNLTKYFVCSSHQFHSLDTSKFPKDVFFLNFFAFIAAKQILGIKKLFSLKYDSELKIIELYVFKFFFSLKNFVLLKDINFALP